MYGGYFKLHLLINTTTHLSTVNKQKLFWLLQISRTQEGPTLISRCDKRLISHDSIVASLRDGKISSCITNEGIDIYLPCLFVRCKSMSRFSRLKKTNRSKQKHQRNDSSTCRRDNRTKRSLVVIKVVIDTFPSYLSIKCKSLSMLCEAEKKFFPNANTNENFSTCKSDNRS